MGWESSSFGRPGTVCGRGAEFGSIRSRRSSVRETKPSIGKGDEGEVDIRRENAGTGTCFKLVTYSSYSSVNRAKHCGKYVAIRESYDSEWYI